MKFRHLLLRRFSAIVVVLFFALPVLSFSAEVSEEVAQRVTANYLAHYVATYGNWAGSDSPATTDSQLIVYNDVPLAYNFRVSPSGHILVAYWDEFAPVLLYSTSSQFIPERVEENGSIESWIIPEIYSIYELIYRNRKIINEEISYGDTRVAKAWEWLAGESRGFSPKAEGYGYKFVTAGPLLSTTWAQGDPYNQQCPAVSGSCSHTLVGCVATAWSQVMKYWNWPTTGTGRHSYTWNGTTLSANFNTTYDWANMPNQLTASSTSTQKAAVAKICYHVGISADMNYGCGSSGSNAYANDVLDVYFKYKSSMQKISRGSHTASQWFALFKAEFDAGTPRPVVLSIWTTTGGGHETVADGYQTGATDKVHVNLGWSGSYNGFYDVTSNFTTGSNTWAANSQVIVTHIEPDQSASNYVSEVLGSNINLSFWPASWTTRIVGAPDNALVSLGSGGYINVKMSRAIINGTGNDFKVYECGTSLGGTSEAYRVYGTSNCSSPTWTLIGSGSDVTSFDLSGTGLSSVPCLRLVDAGTAGGKMAGADFDTVEGLNSSSSSGMVVKIDGTTVTISVAPVPGAESYTLVYAPADLSYTGAYDMGNESSVSFDLWNGAAFYVAVEANRNDGTSISTEFESFHIQ